MQTLRNRLVYRRQPLPGRSEAMRFPLSDGGGDVMTGTLHWPELDGGSLPLLIFLHGLTGSEDSAYMVEGARAFLRRGYPVLRLNLRGAGSSAPLCRGFYSAACYPDILDVVGQLDADLTERGIVFIGVSLGGSVALNLLANLPDTLPCVAAATVCAPLVPQEAASRLMEPRNAIYHRVMVQDMRDGYRALGDALDADLRAQVERVTTLYAVDDKVTAPFHGYRDAEHYYDSTAGIRAVPKISVPLLMLHAANDPWIPVRPYRALALNHPANVTMDITPSGGHVGFHAKCMTEPWHNARIAAFLEGVRDAQP